MEQRQETDVEQLDGQETPAATEILDDKETCTEACDSAEGDNACGERPANEERTVGQVINGAGGIVLKRIHLALGIPLLVALTVGSLFLGMWIHQQISAREGIDPNAKEYQGIFASAGENEGDEITIPGYSDIFFPADTQTVQIVLLNPEGNPCYFRFSLILMQENETIYQSGLIPSGMAVTEIELDRALQQGEYALCVRIEAFSLSDRSEMNGADIETRLIVKQ